MCLPCISAWHFEKIFSDFSAPIKFPLRALSVFSLNLHFWMFQSLGRLTNFSDMFYKFISRKLNALCLMKVGLTCTFLSPNTYFPITLWIMRNILPYISASLKASGNLHNCQGFTFKWEQGKCSLPHERGYNDIKWDQNQCWLNCIVE